MLLLSYFLAQTPPAAPAAQIITDASSSLIAYGPVGAFALLLLGIVWYMLKNQTKAAEKAADQLTTNQRQQQETLAAGLKQIAESIKEGSQRGVEIEKEHSNQIKDLARVNENLTNKLFDALKDQSK